MTDQLQSHRWLVDGTRITPPPEWIALRQRVDELAAMQRLNLWRLIQAVITGDGDLPTLKALAVAEVYPSDVVDQVNAAAHDELSRLYEPVAQRNYRTLAAKFDDAAKRFTACCSRVDVSAVPAEIIDANSKALQAWKDAAVIATELEDLVMQLGCTAELCGMPSDLFAMTFDNNTALIPLTVDTTNLHRRKLWQAWHSTDGRCRRWGPLADLGAKIRAASDPAAVALFPPPAETGVRFEYTESGFKSVPFDPEDPENHTGPVSKLVNAITGRAEEFPS